jgi:hypothetical protein
MTHSFHIVLPALVLGALLAAAAQAQTGAPRTGLAQLGDPYVAPHVRAAARAHFVLPTDGADLQTQALNKIKAKFDEADRDGSGRINRHAAAEAGFGYVLAHFDAIDTHAHGSITFDELKAYLRAHGARF